MATETKYITPEEFIAACPSVAMKSVVECFRDHDFIAFINAEQADGWCINQLVTVPFRDGTGSKIQFFREVP